MNWKEQLAFFEKNKRWNQAIQIMEKVITEDANNMDAYLSINYLLMNLLVEEDHDENKHHYYENLIKKYFKESYSKFSSNAEYLFFTAITAYMSEWYFDIEMEDARTMLQKAMQLDSKNIIYKWAFYGSLDINSAEEKKLANPYAKIILEKNSPIQLILEKKGALGNYLFDIMLNWSKKVIS